ncbi:MAG: hypothetical protein GSR85_06950 [Desulfurococcales archaeon]|nr:hypothetical protein [Desulfurococcales archaeon]
MSWIDDPQKIKIVNIIRKTDIFHSIYKLLLLVYTGIEKTTDVKLILGGNYYYMIKNAETRGLLRKELGGRLVLTEEGRRVAETLYRCLLELEEKGKEER